MSREIDVRDFSTGVMTPERASELQVRAQEASAQLPGTHSVRVARFDQTTGNAAEVVSEGAPPRDGDYVGRALEHVQAIGGALGLTSVAPEFVPDPHVPETSSGARVVHLQQRFHGIPIFEAATMVRFAPDGSIVDAAGSTVNLVAGGATTPALPVEAAVKRAAEQVAEPTDDERGGRDEFGEPLNPEGVDVSGYEPQLLAMATTAPERPAVLSRGPFERDVVANLMWFPVNEQLALTWRVRLTMPGAHQQYEVLVDATSSDILYSHQQVATATVLGNVYKVDPATTARQLTPFPQPPDDYATGSPVAGQHGWRWCNKCQGLFFGDHASQGTCPAGGAHDKSASGDYHLTNNALSAPGQHDWRFCKKCEGLYFSGNGTDGVCAAGGAHDPSASGDYALRFDVPLALGQNVWRWCSKCQGMWFAGNGVAGSCPAGGGHSSAGSGDYRLSHGGPDLPSFPRPWVSAKLTQGNSTNAHLGDAGGPMQGQQTNGEIKFDPANATGDDQKVLNIFYFCCVMHDLFYVLGFREADGNFQVDNFSLGGITGDRVDARSHPGAVFGTANMSPTADGQSPIMNMGLVTSTNRHTAFDSSVVFHEFTHGVSGRLVGGPMNSHALDSIQSGGMGEGWSDYTPCTLNGMHVVGNWVVDNPAGIRGFPYDSSFPDHFGKLGTGRYTEVHNIGEIWCATLIECNRRTEPHTMMQIVVDAFKLTPANPSMPQARDAIVLALDQMLSASRITPDQHAALWQGVWSAFVKFGMGPQAASNGAQLTGIVADFSLGQRDWRFCKKCEGMFFGGNQSQGTCPAGGAHDKSASGDYDMIHQMPAAPGQQGWRWCKKCQGMFFAGNPTQGNCPSGGAHDGSASGAYTLIHAAPAAPGQHDWRWCKKCQGLFFSGHATDGKCPAGAEHDPSASGDYALLVW